MVTEKRKVVKFDFVFITDDVDWVTLNYGVFCSIGWFF